MAFELTTGGLLRFPRFLRDVEAAIRSQQVHRNLTDTTTLLNPHIRVQDLWITLLFACVFLIVRIGLTRVVVPRIFKCSSVRKVSKLSENFCYSVYYICSSAFYFFVVRPNASYSFHLLSNHSSVVRDLLNPFPPPMEFVEHIYYAQACGFYLSASIFLIFLDARLKDFFQMALHHFVTLSLIVISYLYGYVRVGTVVIMLHDAGDIFLYSAKLFHYLGTSGVDTFLFACFAIVFYITRLVMFSRIVHAVVFETLQTLVQEPTFNNWALFYDTYLPHYVVFAVLLGSLILLHCFWYTLVLRLIINELVYGKKVAESGDPRSDDDNDDEDEGSEIKSFRDDEGRDKG